MFFLLDLLIVGKIVPVEFKVRLAKRVLVEYFCHHGIMLCKLF